MCIFCDEGPISPDAKIQQLERDISDLKAREAALERERDEWKAHAGRASGTLADVYVEANKLRVRLGEAERLLRMPVRGGKGQMGVRGRAAQWFGDRDRYFATHNAETKDQP